MKTYLDMDEILRHCRANYRYIGKEDDEHYLVSAVPEEVIRSLPSADVVEVVRCRDCKRYRSWGKVYERKDYTGLCTEWSNMSVHKEDYCSHAVRKSKEGGKKNGK